MDASPWYRDADVDGFGDPSVVSLGCVVPTGYEDDASDCDDTDPSIHPGATETCNGADDDCDDVVDEDTETSATWYEDRDRDGYGNPAVSLMSCEFLVRGYVANDEDCDDTSRLVHPGVDETCNGRDDDCDGMVDVNPVDRWWYVDGDGDGYGDPDLGVASCTPISGRVESGDDCDDTDPDVHPSTYDRPGDGVDQDCDGTDRTLDGVLLDAGDTATTSITPTLPRVGSGYDVGILMDTTASMSGWLSELDLEAVAAALPPTISDVAWAFATFDDYNCCGYGSGSDLPFALGAQVNPDVTVAQAAVHATLIHSGDDGTESSLEGLYQALTGTGYDMACDAVYDASDDVPPFVAGATDPFGGTAAGPYDAAVAGGGSLGGMGFREGALPIVVLVTDNRMRDPDAGYPTPGGCPGDAGATAVATAALDLGAVLAGVSVNSTLPVAQMEALADATGSWADLDADGVVDDPLVWTEYHGMDDPLLDIVSAVNNTWGDPTLFGEVSLVVTDDADGFVADVSPPAYFDVWSTDTVTFTLTWNGVVAETSTTQEFTVVFSVVADGVEVGTVEVTVEVPPDWAP